ncbi:MAG: OmpA family protein [Myxococcota bacterium]
MMNVLTVVSLCGVLWAQAAGLSINLSSVAPEKERPYLTLMAHRPVAQAVVTLKRSDGKTVVLKTGRMKGGAEKKLFLDQPLGTFTYEGTLSATYADDDSEASMPLKFEASILTPPKVLLDEKDLHLEDNRVEVTMDRPARKVQFRVTGDNGEIIDEGEANFPDEPAGTKLPLVWKPGHARVLRIDIIGYDRHGMFSPTLSLFPWSLEIPHQDVNFATGQSVIPPEEMPKVQSALADIQTAIGRYGKVVEIKLYVAGHTDTVGSAETNRALSEARAQSIARAFRKGGIRVPIYYRGHGEDSPKVTTPDETDEPQNRRAEYILAVQEPSAGNWSLLR